MERLAAGEAVSFCSGIDGVDNITTKDIAEAAAKGDITALEIFEISGTHLGKGLSILIDVLNPQRIVIGSIYARCRQFIEPSCMKVIEQEALEPSRSVCSVVPAALGEQVGDFASLSVAIVAKNN
jgi:glucokinase